MIKLQAPDLIFLDLSMPEMNGIKTLEMISEIEGLNTSIYIVTAFHKNYLSELRELSKKGVAFEVAQKPLGSKQISSICEEAFKK